MHSYNYLKEFVLVALLSLLSCLLKVSNDLQELFFVTFVVNEGLNKKDSEKIQSHVPNHNCFFV